MPRHYTITLTTSQAKHLRGLAYIGVQENSVAGSLMRQERNAMQSFEQQLADQGLWFRSYTVGVPKEKARSR